jgi:predicted DNA-binding protein (MmcQ/YjbR family)
MREICLGYPGAVEGEHFGETCFRVGKRMFATCGEKDGVCRIVFQLQRKHADQLVDDDFRFQPYARQPGCVWVDARDVDDWKEIGRLILESYQLNAPPRLAPGRASTAVRKKKKGTKKVRDRRA